MLTPVDIQQKKFHVGLGYEKKDVNAFFEEVVESYEQLYRSNAELREQVNTLTDGLQNYKSKEETLKKTIMHAEKESEDKKSKAHKEAKSIEMDAKNKAKNILNDAEQRLADITEKIAVLETQYAAYRSNFIRLMKSQFDFLEEKDFDVEAKIDDRALAVLAGGMPATVVSSKASAGGDFGSFEGDPQMRDESTLGGFQASAGASYSSGSRDDLTSTSAVYTSNLGAGENFVDPFNTEEQNGRYNPYDGRTVVPKKASTTFTVAESGSNKYRNKNKQSSNSKKTEKSDASSKKEGEPKNNKAYAKTTEKKDSVESIKDAIKDAMDKIVDEIPTVDFTASEAETVPEAKTSGAKAGTEEVEVEVEVNPSTLIGDDDTNPKADEYGFEYV